MGLADMNVWWLSDSLDPIKPKVVRVVLSQQLTSFLPLFTSSSIRNVFDQQLHL